MLTAIPLPDRPLTVLWQSTLVDIEPGTRYGTGAIHPHPSAQAALGAERRLRVPRSSAHRISA